MMRRKPMCGGGGWLGAALVLAFLGAVAAQVRAQGEPPRLEGEPVRIDALADKDRIEKIGPDRYRIGTLTIDARKREIRFPGEVNMREGVVELLACTKDGKRHESVLVADLRPLHLHLALLLLDATPGRNPGVKYEEGAPQLRTAPGDRVAIFVTWKAPGAKEGEPAPARTFRAEDLLLDVRTGKPMPETRWVFQGSCMVEDRMIANPDELEKNDKARPKWQTVERYGADVQGSVIVTYIDSASVLANPLETINDDTVYEARKDVLPAVGTPVEMILIADPPRKKGP